MEPFIGTIQLFAFGFAPKSWAVCDGSLLPIAQNTALFSLLGTTYGGNGQTHFALPDLRGRVPLGAGTGPGLAPYSRGQAGGAEAVALSTSQLPQHTHQMMASTDAQATGNPYGHALGTAGRGGGAAIYATGDFNLVEMGSATASAGGSEPHSNMQPYLTMNYCICLLGTYPTRN